MVDASTTHIGAVLQHFCRSKWAPLPFFFHKLMLAVSHYSAVDRELLAAQAAIRHFRLMLEGQDFFIITDHKPLCPCCPLCHMLFFHCSSTFRSLRSPSLQVHHNRTRNPKFRLVSRVLTSNLPLLSSTSIGLD